MAKGRSIDAVQKENEELRGKLQEMEETLSAIRNGEIDAIVTTGPQGEQIYTLKGADYSYRVLIETMNEAAATLTSSGVVVYCNKSFSKLLNIPLEKLTGRQLTHFISPQDVTLFQALLSKGLRSTVREELRIQNVNGEIIPILLSSCPLQIDTAELCIVLTDLRQIKEAQRQLQKAHDELEQKVEERTAELKKSMETTEKLIQYAPTAIYEIDFQGPRFKSVNEAMCRLSGYSEEELFSLSPLDLLDAESQKRFKERIKKGLTGESIEEKVEYTVLVKDGRKLTVVLNIKPTYKDGKLDSALVIGHDITERKIMEENRQALLNAVQIEKERLNAVMNSIQDEVWFANATKKFTLMNESAVREFNLSSAEDVDVEKLAESLEVFRPDGSLRPVEEAPPLLALEGKTIKNLEEKIRVLSTGEYKWRQVTAAPVRDRDGKIFGSVSVVRDITELKNIEEKLKYNDALLSSFFDSPGIMRGIVEVINDVDIMHIKDNMVTASYVGVTSADLEGKLSSELGEPPERIHIWIKHYKQSQLSGQPVKFEYLDTQGQKQTWLNSTVSYLGQSSSGFPRFAYVVSDITIQKKIEKALIESEERFRVLSEASPIQISVSRKSDGVILYTNKAYNKTFGYDDSELIGRNAPDLYFDSKDREKLMNVLNDQGFVHNYEVIVKKKDDTPFWISASISPIQYAGEKAFIGASLDVTERKKAEDQLRETRDYLDSLLNYANAPIVVWNKDLKIVRFNHAFEHLTGFTSSMVLGKKLDILFPQENKEESVNKIQKTIGGEHWDSVEIPILRKDKTIRTALWNSANIYDDSGKNLVATIAQGIDITERKEAEEAVLQAKLEWERTFDSVPDLIAVLDKSHKIVRANKAMAQRLGIPTEQCVNLNCHVCVHGANKPPAFCPHILTLKDGKEHVAEVYEDKLGGHFLVSTTPIFDAKGTLLGTVHVARDITERKRAEQSLKESENRLQYAQEISHLGSWELNQNNNQLSWSDEVYRIFGLKPQEFAATYEAFLEAVHPDDRESVNAEYLASLRDGRDGYEIEHRIFRRNGEIRFVHEKCEHIRDKSGKVVRSVGMVQDITETKKAETELRRLASFPAMNPMPIVEIDTQGKSCYLNPTSNRLFPDLKKKGFNHPFLKGIKNLLIEIQAKEGKPLIREVHLSNSCYLQTISYIPENQRLRIYSFDITDRKKAEETLQESEEKYRRIVENTTNVIMVTQPDSIISYLSPSSKEIFGYPPEDLVGTNSNIFYPDDIKKVQQAFSKAMNGEKGQNFEYRILTKRGEVKWISHSWSPIIIDNALQSVISVIADITERKTSENEIIKLNENLLRRSHELATANKELETFSYSVSHDLRAPLRSIDGFSQALLEDYGNALDENGKEYLHRVQKATQRMAQLIDDMLRLSRLTRVEMTIKTVDLGQEATTIMSQFKNEDPTRKIDFLKHGNLIGEGDTNLLHILLENMLGNAWKFTKKRKRAEIEFGKTQQGQETVFFIRDNGAGFNMKYANKLFIPFQRLHDDTDYPGTGIGLSIVSRIIHRHGGRIWAEAEEEKGATFYFTLGGKTNE